MSEFVHLHVHSEYSLLDGACRVRELAAAAKRLGQTACAVTDHGNLFAAVEFYNACKAEGIKPIIGCEVYVAERSRFDKDPAEKAYHLILLCKNNIGYKNLSKLVSKAYIEGFYRRPRIDMQLLEQYHEGLICLSACLAGEVSRRLDEGDMQAAKNAALRYRSIFGSDYYLEIMHHDFAEQMAVFSRLITLSQQTGIPLCATNDVHYIEKSDSYAQKILMCINTGKTLDDADRLELPSDDYYLRSGEEMSRLFSRCPQAVTNSVRIAEQCEISFEFGVTKLPYFGIDGVDDNAVFLRNMTFEGLKKRYDSVSQKAEERARYELSVIERMGYVDYFLIVWDFVNYAKTHDIPVGCGRGSGAGSLVAYAVGITDIDPLRYDLIFERFLNPERVSMPDFDIDFCVLKRHKVIEYVISRYGADHVAQIITFGTLGAKQALRDCARVMGLPYKVGDIAARAVGKGMTLSGSIENSPEFRKLYNSDPQFKELADAAKRIENMPRNIATHAAGVVITKDKTDEYVPLFRRDGQVSTQYTMTVLEKLGLLKMDFLGNSALTVNDSCVKEIKKIDPNFDLDLIPLDDADVYKMLSAGKTQGVFQFESAGMTSTLIRLCPNCIDDLIAVLALYRPGPMDSIPTYIRNRRDPSLVTYKHPLLKNILSGTYGCILYQEQVMQIFRELAGYTYGRADIVRRAMSKKKHNELEKERKAFIYGDDEVCGAAANGVDPRLANELFDDMISFASYAFNKSHAAAYATISYQTAYLKCHYYKIYMAALMNVTLLEKPQKLADYLNDISHSGIKMLPLDINKSRSGFCAEQEGIRCGLMMIKGLGGNIISTIEDERKRGGSFVSFSSFCSRLAAHGISLKSLEALIKSGALDIFKNNRREMLWAADPVLKEAQQTAKTNSVGQLNFFDTAFQSGGLQNDILTNAEDAAIPDLDEFDRDVLLEYEYEATGMYLSGHPLEKYEPFALADGCLKSNELSELKEETAASLLLRITSFRQHKTKNGSVMCFAQGEDRSGGCELIIFADLYKAVRALIKTGSAVYVRGRASYKENEPTKLIADMIISADDLIKMCSDRRLCIRTASSDSRIYENIGRIEEKFASEQGGEIVIYLEDKRSLLRSRSQKKVKICTQLISELCTLAGENNVRFMKPPANRRFNS